MKTLLRLAYSVVFLLVGLFHATITHAQLESSQLRLQTFDSFWQHANTELRSARFVTNHFSENNYRRVRSLVETSKSMSELSTVLNNFLRELELPNAEIFLPSDLDYYLYQAITARKSSQRKALNHIGISITRLDGQFVVTNVLANYPAQKLDIRRGDVIESVNGLTYHPVWSFNDVEKIKPSSRASETFSLTYLRNGHSNTVSINPVYENLYDSYRTVTVNSTNQFVSGNKTIGYVQILATSRSLNDLISYKELFSDFSRSDALIIDLRDAFGYIQWENIDPFFPSRNTYFQKSTMTADGKSASVESAPAQSNRYYYDRPLVILINGDTRADMELLAYQLKKLSNSTVVGSPTRGFISGSDSMITDSSNSFVLVLPTQKLTIDGLNLEAVGVSPDYEIHNPIDRTSVSDLQLEAGVSTLMNSI